MNFNTFLEKLNIVEEVETLEDIDFEVVETVTAEMFPNEAALYVEMLDDNYHVSEMVGLAWGTSEKVYVSKNIALLQDPLMKMWLEDVNQKKEVYDAKRTIVAIAKHGTRLKGVSFDVLLGAYLLDTNDLGTDMAAVAQQYGYTEIQSDVSIYGKGAKRALPEDGVMFEHLARKIKVIKGLTNQLEEALAEKNQDQLFHQMELPLSEVLAEMEIIGITVDSERLEHMRVDFAKRLHEIETKIYEMAGETFNLNSPKQLGVILFEKMGLPVIKKTKTGYSTAVDVLEQLREQAPIVDDILIYRQISKIQSTYIEGLLKMIQADGRVHTRYVQTLTQTGRLSSVDPNLQNIPIRLEEGRRIREAFVPKQKDWLIYASDYSQIELRVLAHISDDEHLKQAFIEGQDIHTSTAMRVFGIEDPKEVTANMRRQAKAVNFGIVYGISDYGLSQNLGISRKEAQQYIDTYFERYPGVKTFMQEIVREAKDTGYVETLFHRRRYLPEINSRNFNLRSFAERTAINSPIQGSAADIIKMAMIQLEKRLKEEKLEAKMLLQVHDELVFEVPENELTQLDALVKEVMENAVTLTVPLVTDSSWGKTWYEAK